VGVFARQLRALLFRNVRNIDPVMIWWWLRWRKRIRQEKINKNSGAYIVSKELNQDPEKDSFRLIDEIL
jgi:hypothetical protein